MRLAALSLVVLRILVLSALFLTVFAGMALGVACVLAWFQDSSITAGTNLYLGMVCGLVAWLFVAVFHFRRETLNFPFSDKDVFLNRLKDALDEMGYELIGQSDDQLRFHPTFKAFLLGGGISVKLESANSKIVGPRVNLESLRHRLRLQHHLEIVQQSIHETRRRQPEHLLKRVQVTVRLPQNGGWARVVGHLQTILGKESAMIGDLHILLQSNEGIRERLIDEDVRNWLQERGAVVEIHKNHVKMLRPSSADISLPPVADEVRV